MAPTAERMLSTGQPFPYLKFNLLTGKEVLQVLFPGNSGRKWNVFLFYCGSSCLGYHQQLIRLQQVLRNRKRGNLKVVGALSGNREQAVETAWNLQTSFPVAYGVDFEMIDVLYGKKRPDSCPTGFLIHLKGKLSSSFNGNTRFHPAGFVP